MGSINKEKNQTRPTMAQIWNFTCKDFTVDIMNMFKELKEIMFKELNNNNNNMVLIEKSLQGNENYKNLPYGNSQTEKFNN